jgi:hypothetical protein
MKLGRKRIVSSILATFAVAAVGFFVTGLAMVLGFNSQPIIPVPASSAVPSPCKSTATVDVRIAEFSQMGINIGNEGCGAPCRSSIVPPIQLDVFVDKVGIPDRLYGGLDGPNFVVSLIYVGRGFIADAKRPISDNYKETTREMLVGTITLLNTRNADDLLREYGCAFGSIAYEFTNAQTWNGYGPVKVLAR